MKTKERPIIFSGPMVRAILEGRKTQTRRLVRPQPKVIHAIYDDASLETNCIFRSGDQRIHCPYGQPGDRLWVRETFSLNHSIHYAHDNGRGTTGMIYRASWDGDVDFYKRPFEGERRWKPSIHMPRWASRISLEIVRVRVQRVQEISEKDARDEGAIELHEMQHRKVPRGDTRARCRFAVIWNSINAKRGFGWDKNPWVWVVEFKRVDP